MTVANKNTFRGLGLDGQVSVMLELLFDSIIAGVDAVVAAETTANPGDVTAAVSTQVKTRLDALDEATAQTLIQRYSTRVNRAMWG